MILKKAKTENIPEIMKIINDAKNYFAAAGINQWQDGYPNESSLTVDIEKSRSYICDGNKIFATAALCFGPERDYKNIYEGEWLSSLPYAAIHRIAVSDSQKGKGIAGKFMSELFSVCAENGVKSVRIDTHAKNLSMQRMLSKCGFTYCGIIYLTLNGDARNAYELLI